MHSQWKESILPAELWNHFCQYIQEDFLQTSVPFFWTEDGVGTERVANWGSGRYFLNISVNSFFQVYISVGFWDKIKE